MLYICLIVSIYKNGCFRKYPPRPHHHPPPPPPPYWRRPGSEVLFIVNFPLRPRGELDVVKDENSQFWPVGKRLGCIAIGSPDGRIIELAEGDLVFVPHGSAHWIADKSTSLRMPSPEFVKARRAGIPVFNSGGDVTTLIAGHFEFDYLPMHPFFKGSARQLFHIRQYVTENLLLLKQVTQLMLEELNNERPGSSVMLKSLSEIMFTSNNH